MKQVIFDFDGSIANSLPVIIEIAEEMLGIEISKQDVERYRNMTAKQLLKEAKIPVYKLPGLLVKGRTILRKRTDEIEMFKGLDKVISNLSQDHRLYVVSSNGLGIINAFLRKCLRNLRDISAMRAIPCKTDRLRYCLIRPDGVP